MDWRQAYASNKTKPFIKNYITKLFIMLLAAPSPRGPRRNKSHPRGDPVEPDHIPADFSSNPASFESTPAGPPRGPAGAPRVGPPCHSLPAIIVY